MKKLTNMLGMLAAMSLAIAPAPAFAKDYEFAPFAEEGASIRYLQGVPTISIADETGGGAGLGKRLAFTSFANEDRHAGTGGLTVGALCIRGDWLSSTNHRRN